MNEIEQKFLKYRKQIIEMQYPNLNDMQKRAVFQTNGAVLILAGAGSGKTTVLVNRVTNLLRFGNGYHSDRIPPSLSPDDISAMEVYINNPSSENLSRIEHILSVDKAYPYGILAITFTNKAAGELKERLSLMLGESSEDVWACTFHSACVRILRRNIDKIGMDNSFSIYDADDTIRIIKNCQRELNIDEKRFAPRAVYSQISRAKNRLMNAEDFKREHSSDYYMNEISKIYSLYQQKLKDASALDFDDIISYTVELLRRDASIRDFYQNKFKYVLVDEYQDTNHAQYVLVNLLSAKYKNICVVGDDDQSIYKFRGATIENILNFENEYPDALVIRLEQNYRSTKNILSAANDVISNNKTRRAKSLWTTNPEGDCVRIYSAQNDDDESRFVAKTIEAAVVQEKRKYNNFAILYRINAQSNNMERMLSKMGMPYRIIGGVRFYERAEVKDIVAYLQLVENPDDDLRLRRVINVPKRGIGKSTLTALESSANMAGISMFETILRSESLIELKGSSRKLMVFGDIINKLREMKDKLPLDEFITFALKHTGIIEELEFQNTEEARGRIENLKELVSNAVVYMNNNPQNQTLRGFLEEIALYSDLDQHEEGDDCVLMLTIHSAKGLEFDTVFLISGDDGIFPSIRAFDSPEDMEEERRLCYVAITRAKKSLYITHSRERLVFGKTMRYRPSRFLEEIPSELKEIVGAKNRPRSSISDKPGALQPKGDDMSMFAKRSFKKPGQVKEVFNKGERVNHKMFGEGMVLSSKPMGNDTYLEVAFDKVGTKKLMANFAKLKKI